MPFGRLEEENLSEFSEVLKKKREEKGFTQVETAKLLLITERQYQRLESGDSKPSLKTAMAVCELFGISLRDIK
jgi:DNA-binding XRE family transcriptional regulator